MSRLERVLRRCAATALLLVVALTWVPLARANGNGSLTGHYPLGTQTLCCQAGSGHSRPGSTTTKVAPAPRTPSTRSPTRGHGGISILLVVVIAVIAVIAFALLAVIFRAGLSPPGRGTRHDPKPSPEPELEPDGAYPGASSVDVPSAHVRTSHTEQDQISPEPVNVEPFPDDGEPPGVSREADARPSSDLEEVPPDEVESGDVAFNLGVLLYERGHLGPAEASWRRAAERHHARAATRLGMALEQRGDVDGASEAYRDAERWGDAVGSERAAALSRPDQPSAGFRSAEESDSE